jgi:hypothetical protein
MITPLHTYTTMTEEKASWGDGPWHAEPDKVQWRDEATGLPCLVKRNRLGAWCGYVGVTEEHPLFGKDYNDVDGWSDEPLAEIAVHGGLTYSGFCQTDCDEAHAICHIPEPGESDHVWWFGFDCGHHSDLCPEMAARYPDLAYGTYRDIDYVQIVTTDLAAQLAAAA